MYKYLHISLAVFCKFAINYNIYLLKYGDSTDYRQAFCPIKFKSICLSRTLVSYRRKRGLLLTSRRYSQ